MNNPRLQKVLLTIAQKHTSLDDDAICQMVSRQLGLPLSDVIDEYNYMRDMEQMYATLAKLLSNIRMKILPA